MRKQNLFQRTSRAATVSLFTLSAGALLTVSSVSAFAATPDYSKFQSVFNATGTLSPDSSTISFPLFRQDLTLTITLADGNTFPAPAETAAPGYINVKKLATPSTFFFDAAFPALTSELPALEQTLTTSGFHITSIETPTTGLSQQITVVNIEGTRTEPEMSLANAFLGVLQTIMQPQLNVSVFTVMPGNIPMPVPPKFQKLLDNGQFTALDGNVLLFALPLKDANPDAGPAANPLYLGSVLASPSLGVQQSIFISGYGYSVLHADLVLKPGQVMKVEDMLTNAGFTLSAAGNPFIDASKPITVLHAIATSPDPNAFYSQGEALAQILAYIK